MILLIVAGSYIFFFFIEKPQTFRHVNVHMIYSVHTYMYVSTCIVLDLKAADLSMESALQAAGDRLTWLDTVDRCVDSAPVSQAQGRCEPSVLLLLLLLLFRNKYSHATTQIHTIQ